MTIGNFFGVLGRRWLLVLVGFLLTVAMSGAAYKLFKPTYEVTGTVLFLPPKSSLVTGSPNPYLQLGGLAQAVDLVSVALSDQATQLELRTISKDVVYTAKQDVNSSSPLLVIDVKDSSPDTALKIRDTLMARVPEELQKMQDVLSVSSNDRVTTTVVTLDAEAQEVGKNRLRAAVVAACLGLGLTLVAATVWDAYRMRRPRARRDLRQGPGAEESDDPSEAEPDADQDNGQDSDSVGETNVPSSAVSPTFSDDLDTIQEPVDVSRAD